MSHTGMSVKQGFAAGGSIAAALVMFVAGVVSIFQGVAAIASDELFVIGVEYTFAFDTTVWGWIHLLVGALVTLVAIAVMTGASWAKLTAIVIACFSIIANFLWLPYYPLWAILIIALDVVVIWALATWAPGR